MPMPMPRDGETRDEFIVRCLNDESLIEEFPDADDRRAAALRRWEDAHPLPSASPVTTQTVCENWAIVPEALAELELIARTGAPHGSPRFIRPAAQVGTARTRGGVAVLPLRGVIAHRAGALDEFFGIMSIDGFRRRFRESLADPSVGSIVIDVDSPGGQVAGVPEIAAEIRAARGTKRIVAVANTLAASAAYWIATAADEVVVTPSGEVGSIGVIAVHEDITRMLDLLGVKITVIKAGRFKDELSPFVPLGDDARAAVQARVDEFYDMFVRDVAAGRGVEVSAVRSGFGEGRVVGAREAVVAGMADRIAPLEEVVAELASGSRRRRRSSARAHTFDFL